MGCEIASNKCCRKLLFQSTHPCGVRNARKQQSEAQKMFQSTHPCGVRNSNTAVFTKLKRFQSTHPCGVRTDPDDIDPFDRDVSIHAPVWGAKLQATDGRWIDSFNPRTRVGCETINPSCPVYGHVSIHAPVWGANLLNSCCFHPLLFQSTHPCGVRN